jgi:hypothetical protein
MEINEVNHASILNASLLKIYNQAKIKGKLESIDLYLLNVLFKYISDCNLVLTHDQKKKLQCIYRLLYNTSPDICKVNNLQSFKTPASLKTKFIVADKTDQPTPPLIPKVYYWQEPTPFTEYPDIITAIVEDDYLLDKPFINKTEFTFTLEVKLDYIGRVCFAFEPGFTSSGFVIKDVLGNDVTHAFTRHDVLDLKVVLFVSEWVHSHGEFIFTIIETPGEEGLKIFNNVYNNTFA